MYKFSDVDEAIRECERFLQRAKVVKKLEPSYTGSPEPKGCHETADLRRASMDLTRVLTRLRNE